MTTKPFDYDAAKRGEPVKHDGEEYADRIVRIICWDFADPEYPLAVESKSKSTEKAELLKFTKEGRFRGYYNGHPFDLVMAPKKIECWARAYKTDMENIYVAWGVSPEQIERLRFSGDDWLGPAVKVWEEEE